MPVSKRIIFQILVICCCLNVKVAPSQATAGNLKLEMLNCTVSGNGGESMTCKGKLLKSTGTTGRDLFDTLLSWPHASTGLMNCATYTAEISGLKAGEWAVETQIAMNSPNTCTYTIKDGSTSTMKVLIGKNGCESDFEDYLSFADLTPPNFSSPTAPYTFRLVTYPGKTQFGSVDVNSIRVQVTINGEVHYMQSSSPSRWAYTLDDKCSQLKVVDSTKPWQKGFEYSYTIDFDTKTEQGAIKHLTQHYPPNRTSRSIVDHAGTIYFASSVCDPGSSEITYGDQCFSKEGPCIPVWKHIEYCDRDKPLNRSYEYEFAIHNLSAKTQISRIEMAPFEDNEINAKFLISATLPVTLQCGDLFKFKVYYKPDITDCWSKLPQLGLIKAWITTPGAAECEGASLYINYIMIKK